MNRSVISILMLLCLLCVSAQQWSDDILGNGFVMRHVEHGNDYRGKVISTIIKKHPSCKTEKGILYIHGYNDYFFQREMAEKFVDSGYNFYAVDLRKYGRSLISGQKPFETREICEYFADIDSAIVQMRHDGITKIILMGHSTGGLISALYVKTHLRNEIKTLILNSPFFDWNLSRFTESIIPAISWVGSFLPNISIAQEKNQTYAESLLLKYNGEWDYDTSWKFEQSPAVTLGWIRAITLAQRELQDTENLIRIPILLMHSDKSDMAPDSSDIVLDIKDISRLGRKIGHHVTEFNVHNGLHDLFLSRKCVRESLYSHIFNWLKQNDI